MNMLNGLIGQKDIQVMLKQKIKKKMLQHIIIVNNMKKNIILVDLKQV